MSQRTQVSTKKASRKVNSSPIAKTIATTPTVKTPETVTPLGDAIRNSGCYGDMLVDNIEGLAYYQQAKSVISEMFITSMTVNVRGEMSDEYKQFHIDLHRSIQDLFDAIHKEYREGLREKGLKTLRDAGITLDTENYA